MRQNYKSLKNLRSVRKPRWRNCVPDLSLALCFYRAANLRIRQPTSRVKVQVQTLAKQYIYLSICTQKQTFIMKLSTSLLSSRPTHPQGQLHDLFVTCAIRRICDTPSFFRGAFIRCRVSLSKPCHFYDAKSFTSPRSARNRESWSTFQGLFQAEWLQHRCAMMPRRISWKFQPIRTAQFYLVIQKEFNSTQKDTMLCKTSAHLLLWEPTEGKPRALCKLVCADGEIVPSLANGACQSTSLHPNKVSTFWSAKGLQTNFGQCVTHDLTTFSKLMRQFLDVFSKLGFHEM